MLTPNIQNAPSMMNAGGMSPGMMGPFAPMGAQATMSWEQMLLMLMQALQGANGEQLFSPSGQESGMASMSSPSFGGGGGGSSSPDFAANSLGNFLGNAGPQLASLGSGNSAFGGSPYSGGASNYSAPSAPQAPSSPAFAPSGGADFSPGDFSSPTLGGSQVASAASVMDPSGRDMRVGTLAMRDPATGEVHNFNFNNGGFGRGSIPDGTYEVSNGRRRSDVGGMMVDGYGYSFDLTQSGQAHGTADDPRYATDRSLLRVHPDGGSAGTQGCIGIVGGREEQERFYELASRLAEQNGGSFELQFGAPQERGNTALASADQPSTTTKSTTGTGTSTGTSGSSTKSTKVASNSSPSSSSTSTSTSKSSSSSASKSSSSKTA